MPSKRSSTTKKPAASVRRIGPFTGDDVIADVIARFPGAIETLLTYGLHCVGCSANTADTIAQGARSHGIDDATIETMLEAVNMKAEAFAATMLEGNGVFLSPVAHEAILAIAKTEKKTGTPLRVEVQGGGCDGFTYVLDFDASRPDDVVYPFGDVTLVAAPADAAKFAGSLIDYLDGPMGTGFKVDNPNPTGCTCGTHTGHRA